MTIEVGGGGGGIFRTETFVFNQSIASGQTGDLVIIGMAGKLTKLTSISTDSSSRQSGMSIVVDGVTLVGPDNLSGTPPGLDSDWFISQGSFNGDINRTGAAMGDVIGEFITIRKNAGNTTQIIKYAYQTGVIK